MGELTIRNAGNGFAEHVGRRITFKHKRSTIAAAYVGKVIGIVGNEALIHFDGGHKGWRNTLDLEVMADTDQTVASPGADATVR